MTPFHNLCIYAHCQGCLSNDEKEQERQTVISLVSAQRCLNTAPSPSSTLIFVSLLDSLSLSLCLCDIVQQNASFIWLCL